ARVNSSGFANQALPQTAAAVLVSRASTALQRPALLSLVVHASVQSTEVTRGYAQPASARHTAFSCCLRPYRGPIGFSAATSCSYMNGCLSRPENAYSPSAGICSPQRFPAVKIVYQTAPVPVIVTVEAGRAAHRGR